MFTESQILVLAIISKIVSSLSFLGSFYLIVRFYRNRRLTKKSLYHRIILYISIVDIIGSVNFFIGPWVFKNDVACTIQGFIVEMYIAIPLWNIAHAVNVYMRVIKGWHADKAKALEPLYHLFAWSIPIVGGSIGVYRQVYKPVSSWCWYSADSVDLRFGTFYSWVFLAMFVSIAVALAVTLHVKKKQEGSTKSKAYLAGKRQVLYSLAILLTFGPSSLTRIVQLISGIQLFELTCFQVATLPLQGFANFLINYIMMQTTRKVKRKRYRLMELKKSMSSYNTAFRSSFSSLSSSQADDESAL